VEGSRAQGCAVGRVVVVRMLCLWGISPGNGLDTCVIRTPEGQNGIKIIREKGITQNIKAVKKDEMVKRKMY
jgi:hypothetical protein